ncbi:hypothetical protein DFH06DRAFT_1137347 [Mycena polygramma]|nr:hypothetical protein DFH06DRAFT_1137347 [Mycena polygramma]
MSLKALEAILVNLAAARKEGRENATTKDAPHSAPSERLDNNPPVRLDTPPGTGNFVTDTAPVNEDSTQMPVWDPQNRSTDWEPPLVPGQKTRSGRTHRVYETESGLCDCGVAVGESEGEDSKSSICCSKGDCETGWLAPALHEGMGMPRLFYFKASDSHGTPHVLLKTWAGRRKFPSAIKPKKAISHGNRGGGSTDLLEKNFWGASCGPSCVAELCQGGFAKLAIAGRMAGGLGRTWQNMKGAGPAGDDLDLIALLEHFKFFSEKTGKIWFGFYTDF